MTTKFTTFFTPVPALKNEPFYNDGVIFPNYANIREVHIVTSCPLNTPRVFSPPFHENVENMSANEFHMGSYAVSGPQISPMLVGVWRNQQTGAIRRWDTFLKTSVMEECNPEIELLRILRASFVEHGLDFSTQGDIVWSGFVVDEITRRFNAGGSDEVLWFLDDWKAKLTEPSTLFMGPGMDITTTRVTNKSPPINTTPSCTYQPAIYFPPMCQGRLGDIMELTPPGSDDEFMHFTLGIFVVGDGGGAGLPRELDVPTPTLQPLEDWELVTQVTVIWEDNAGMA
jgi:hypothetical protein